MKTKAFTLIELMLATILGMLVMIGSVGVIENMQRESQNFQSRITDNMTWVEANQRIAQLVRSSSYIELSNPIAGTDPVQYTTMTLHDYNDAVRGVFNNTPDGITYTNDATGIGNRDANNPFRNINATFADPATPANPQKGRASNGKQIETIVNYTVNYEAPSTMPFTSAISLGCRVAVAGETSDTWAATYYGSSTGYGNPIHEPGSIARKTTDGGYIYVDTVENAVAGVYTTYVYVLKITKDGKHEWSYLHNRGGTGRDIRQTSDGGYIIVGEHNACATLTKLYSDGSFNWRKVIMSGSPLNPSRGSCVIEADGYVVIAWYAESGKAYNGPAHIIKTDLAGNPVTDGLGNPWDYKVSDLTASGGYPYPEHIGITASYSTDGGAVNGYVIAGHNVIKLSTSKNLIWKTTENTYLGYTGNDIQQVFNAAGEDNGYVIAGMNGWLMALYRIDKDGNPQWVQQYPHVPYTNGSANSVKQIPGGYVLTGESISTSSFIAYFVKTDTNGNAIEDRVFDAGTSNGGVTWPIRYYVECADDGGYLISGLENKFLSQIGVDPQAYFIKTNSKGECPEASKPTKYTDLPILPT